MYNQYSFESFQFSSAVIRDLVAEKAAIKPFIHDFYTVDAILEQAKAKNFSIEKRNTLVQQLNAQSGGIELTTKTRQNIEALKSDDAFTITTGHQLNLLTGPLYSIYKVAQVIAISQAVNNKQTEKKMIPVFWMATEDHDFEEINHLRIFGKKLEWTKENQLDAIVGAIKTAGMTNFLTEVEETYREEEMQKAIADFTAAYRSAENLAGATRRLMNHLFGAYGLVIIDGNDVELKKAFKPVAKQELETRFVHKHVTETNTALEKVGYHQQVHVRNCNLFYIAEDDTRKRIANEDGTFLVGDNERSLDDLLTELDEHPARFSPNALLRPIYQELILPNLVYVGGGGEIAYWLQLKGVFNALSVQIPLLRVRDSFVLLDQRSVKDLEELGLSVPKLKRDWHDIMKEIALEDVAVEIELTAETEALNSIKDKLVQKATNVNKGLAAMVEAEFVKMEKSIERIEAKLVKAEKSKHEQKGKKLEKLQSKIFPKGGFQERYDNFIPYYLSDKKFVSKIVDNLKAENTPIIRILEM